LNLTTKKLLLDVLTPTLVILQQRKKKSLKKKPVIGLNSTKYDIVSNYEIGELKEWCEKNGLSAKGKYDDIIERIVDHLYDRKRTRDAKAKEVPDFAPKQVRADRTRQYRELEDDSCDVEETEESESDFLELEKNYAGESESESDDNEDLDQFTMEMEELAAQSQQARLDKKAQLKKTEKKEKVEKKKVEKATEVVEETTVSYEEEPSTTSEQQKVFFIIGKFEGHTIGAIKSLIVESGSEWSSTLSNACTHLMVSNPSSYVAQVKKAKELGLTIVGAEYLEELK